VRRPFDAGVVVGEIQPAETLDRLLDQPPDFAGPPDIGWNENGLASAAGDGVYRLPTGADRDVRHDNFGPFPGKRQRRRPANSSGRTCDQCDFAAKRRGCHFSSS
jgi:hypothetical protein